MRFLIVVGIFSLSLTGSRYLAALDRPRPASADSQSPATETRGTTPALFTADQAKRGATLYLNECARCHAESLAGTESGPALIGDEFLAAWSQGPLSELFEKIQAEMPQDSPGRLSRKQNADILAHILSGNGLPEGATELTSDAAALKKIWLRSK